MRTAALTVLVPLAIFSLLSGCSQKPYLIEATQNNTVVKISGREFVPSIIKVPVGTTVTWINHGGDAHSVTSSAGLFDGVLEPVTGSFSFTFKQSGSYEYYCQVYDYQVMTGRVVVE